MRRSETGRLTALTTSTLAALALVLVPAAPAGAKKPPPVRAPRANTGAATHVLGTSALLTAVINPNGDNVETTYFFQWGPTNAYGLQTPTATLTVGAPKTKVGQSIAGLSPGVAYHFRAVAVANGVTYPGPDHVFLAKGNALAFSFSRRWQDTFGSPVVLSGTLTGLNSANHRIVLQASPFPYLEPFANIGAPGVTDAAGRFSFRVSNLAGNTQFRVSTLDPLPVYSLVSTVEVAVAVTIHARSRGQVGLVRLYGTVSPAVPGAQVLFQVQKAVRPGKSEATNRWVTELSTTTKRGIGNSSRYSAVVTIRHGGRYRAFVRLRHGAGPLTSGASRLTIILHAAPSAGRRHK